MAKTSDNKNSLYEVYMLLLESSLRSIPFNIALATLLVIDLHYHQSPLILLIYWYSGIIIISVFRWLHNKNELKKRHKEGIKTKIYYFTFLVFLTSILWGTSYFIFSPYITLMNEFIIILVLGGMSAGAVASLSVFLPAYYAYIIPMFLPIIIYNFYSFQVDRIILAFMCLLFLLMLIVTAKINARLLQKNISVTKENQWLIKRLSRANANLETTNEKLMNSIEEIRIMSITDPLTGLYNRRHFNNTLKLEIAKAKRNEHIIHLLLIDVDNFKYVNDTFGHPAGDSLLIKVGNSLRQSLRRANDTIYRLGGDEFAITLLNIKSDEALKICNTIQQRFNLDIADPKLSLSIGLITITPNVSLELDDIIAEADKALYQAKNEGRNRIIAINL